MIIKGLMTPTPPPPGHFSAAATRPPESEGLHATLYQWTLLARPANWGAHQLWLERCQPRLPVTPEAVWGESGIQSLAPDILRRVCLEGSVIHHFYPQQNLISKSLESKEASVSKLNEDGEKLIASNHPGKNVIEVDATWSAGFIFCVPDGGFKSDMCGNSPL